jgi:oligogalacturonide lyase
MFSSLAVLALAASPFTAQTHSSSPTKKELPPETWVYKDTGHRVWRISDEPNSGAFYFNINSYNSDHKP